MHNYNTTCRTFRHGLRLSEAFCIIERLDRLYTTGAQGSVRSSWNGRELAVCKAAPAPDRACGWRAPKASSLRPILSIHELNSRLNEGDLAYGEVRFHGHDTRDGILNRRCLVLSPYTLEPFTELSAIDALFLHHEFRKCSDIVLVRC